MKYNELSKYFRSKLNRARVCPECGGIIFDDDDFVIEQKTIGRCKFYIFSHERCVSNVKIIKKAKE